MIDFGRYSRALIRLYYRCAVKATSGLIRNWITIFGALLSFIAYSQAITLLANFGMAGGFIAGIIELILLTLYYSWVDAAVKRERLTFKELYQINWGLFFGLISIAFIIYLITLVVQLSQLGPNISVLIYLAIILLWNAAPELVYLEQRESMDALRETFEFIHDNWIEWYIPFILMISPLLFVVGVGSSLQVISLTNPLLPSLVIAIEGTLLYGLLGGLIGAVLTHWFTVFRAHLFLELRSGSRRQRMFREGI
jgi:hypothetical protein